MVRAAKQGAEAQSYAMSRLLGRGLSNMWTVTKGGVTRKASIRTSRDRWIAFQPVKNGTAWKTLGEVDLVIVSVVDSKEDPQNVEVYIFPADDVRSRFDKAYAVRLQAGQVQKDGFGMWVCLDHDPRGITSSVGSGIVGKYGMIASYPIASLLQAAPAATDDVTDADEVAEDQAPPEVQQTKSDTAPKTIGEVMAWARERVAQLASVPVGAVKLDLKVEY